MPKVVVFRFLFFVFVCVLFFLNFNFNYFHVAGADFYSRFQLDSESLVLGRVLQDFSNPNYDSVFGLGFADVGVEGIYKAFELKKTVVDYREYISNFGLQGDLYTLLYNKLGGQSLEFLKGFCSALTSFFIVSLLFVSSKIFGLKFAICIAISLFFSPWIVLFSNNLYWSPYTWFAPVLFSWLIFAYSNVGLKLLFSLLFFLSVFIKCLFGYEYLSAVLIFASLPVFVLPVLNGRGLNYKSLINQLSLLLGLSVLAFSAALALHADLRAESLTGGLSSIWYQDVLRRTHGDSVVFNPVYRESLEATIWDVIILYLISWRTDILYPIPGSYFLYAFLFCLSVLAYEWIEEDKKFKFNFLLFLVSFLAGVSWLVLAKAHSYIHQHMNYVLWYLGFVSSLLYLTIIGAEHFWSLLRSSVYLDKVFVLLRIVLSHKYYRIIFVFCFITGCLIVSVSADYLNKKEILTDKLQEAELIYQDRDFSVYVSKELILFKSKSCDRLVNERRFFVHVYGMKGEFINLDFNWFDIRGGGSLNSDTFIFPLCMVDVNLPQIAKQKLVFGQFKPGSRFWQVEHRMSAD